ncbi:MAG: nuclear transport factor 2 family protein [Spongiibacteraceae bacterium]
MNNLEQRLQTLEDRQTLQDTLTAYLVAIDAMSSIDDILKCLTEDAEYDMSAINYPCFKGSAAVREFFSSVFNNMSHQAHYATNFHIDHITANTASCRSHVIGKAITKDADEICIYLQYLLEFKRGDDGWKICSIYSKPLLPL